MNTDTTVPDKAYAIWRDRHPQLSRMSDWRQPDQHGCSPPAPRFCHTWGRMLHLDLAMFTGHWIGGPSVCPFMFILSGNGRGDSDTICVKEMRYAYTHLPFTLHAGRLRGRLCNTAGDLRRCPATELCDGSAFTRDPL